MLRDMPGIISRMLAVSLRFTLYRDWFMPDEERVEQNSLYTLPAGAYPGSAAGKVGDPGHGAQRQGYALLPNFCYAFLCCGTALGCQQVHASCVSLEHLSLIHI